MMENIHPPLPAPAPMPRMLNSQPPMTAPTMPIVMVTIIPPGSSPGITNLASAPAISPTTTQNNNAPNTSTCLLTTYGTRHHSQDELYPRPRIAYNPQLVVRGRLD